MHIHIGMKQNVAMTVVMIGALFVAAPRMTMADGQQNGGLVDVLAAILPQDAAGEPFRDVVTNVVKYRLARQGLAVAVTSEESITFADQADAALLKAAKTAGAPIALACRYASDGSQMEISLKWHETQTGATVSASNKGSVDLQFDSVILAALDALLVQVQDRVSQLMAQKAEAARAAQAAAAQAKATEARTEPSGTTPAQNPPPQGGAAAQVASEGTEPKSAGAPQSLPQPAESSRELPRGGPTIQLSAGVAGFLALGAAADYFTVGVRPSLLGDFFFDAPMGRFGVGLFTAVNYFSAQGVVENSNGFLVPFGPDLRYELAIGTLFALHIRLTGGPAILVLATQAQGTLAKLLPFIAGGLGADFLITPKIALGLGADYEIYFETPYPIMGVSPSLNVSLKL